MRERGQATCERPRSATASRAPSKWPIFKNGTAAAAAEEKQLSSTFRPIRAGQPRPSLPLMQHKGHIFPSVDPPTERPYSVCSWARCALYPEVDHDACTPPCGWLWIGERRLTSRLRIRPSSFRERPKTTTAAVAAEAEADAEKRGRIERDKIRQNGGMEGRTDGHKSRLAES